MCACTHEGKRGKGSLNQATRLLQGGRVKSCVLLLLVYQFLTDTLSLEIPPLPYP